MGLVYRGASITPSKRDLMNGWLPGRPWFDGDLERKPVGSFRFDDPDGEVGMEGFLLGRDGASTIFVPMTYRGAELPDAGEHLIGTTEHTVLGPRWVYDGCGDPLFVRALVDAIVTGGRGVDMEVEEDGERQVFPTTASVHGSGTAGSDVSSIQEVGCHDEGPVTVVDAGQLELVVVRVVGTDAPLAQTLTGSWDGVEDAILAGVRPG